MVLDLMIFSIIHIFFDSKTIVNVIWGEINERDEAEEIPEKYKEARKNWENDYTTNNPYVVAHGPISKRKQNHQNENRFGKQKTLAEICKQKSSFEFFNFA